MNKRTAVTDDYRQLFGVSIRRLLGIEFVECLLHRCTGRQQVRNRYTQGAGQTQDLVISDTSQLRFDLGKRPATDVPSLQTDASSQLVLGQIELVANLPDPSGRLRSVELSCSRPSTLPVCLPKNATFS